MKSPPVRYVSVVCPDCGVRLDERLGESARTVNCPGCSTPLRIPSVDEVKADRGQRPAQRERETETYGLQSKEPPPAAAPRKTRQPLVATVACPVCGARLRRKPRSEPYCVNCPECQEPVRIPSRGVVRKRCEEYRPQPLEPEEPLPARSTVVRTDYWETRSALRNVAEEPDPPRWTFFSDVWLFVFHREMLSRWFFLSVGIGALSGLILIITTLFGGVSGYVGVVLAFFALPAIWIGIWTGSYAASCWLVILEDTAGGNRTIHNWHQQNWREWVLHATYLSYLLSIALVIGHGLGKLAELGGVDYWLVQPPTVGLLFPIVVLSSLQASEWWAILTRPVLTSLWSEFPAWVLFYLLSTGLLLGTGGVVWTGLTISPLLSLPFTAPFLAAAWFTYGRLLGRLGWLISRQRSGVGA